MHSRKQHVLHVDILVHNQKWVSDALGQEQETLEGWECFDNHLGNSSRICQDCAECFVPLAAMASCQKSSRYKKGFDVLGGANPGAFPIGGPVLRAPQKEPG